MAAAGAARRVLVLLLLGVLPAGPRPGALATEHYTPLSLLKQELQHRQQQEAPAGGGCSPQSGDWGDQYSAECGGEWAGGQASGCRGAGGADVPAARASPTPGAARAPARAGSTRCHPGAASRRRRAPSSRSRLGGGRRTEERAARMLPGPGRPLRSPSNC